jgi:hypothetical protein
MVFQSRPVEFILLLIFYFGTDTDLSGIFVFEKAGVLAGLEVYGLAGDASKTLPAPESLKPFSDATKSS